MNKYICLPARAHNESAIVWKVESKNWMPNHIIILLILYVYIWAQCVYACKKLTICITYNVGPLCDFLLWNHKQATSNNFKIDINNKYIIFLSSSLVWNSSEATGRGRRSGFEPGGIMCRQAGRWIFQVDHGRRLQGSRQVRRLNK